MVAKKINKNTKKKATFKIKNQSNSNKSKKTTIKNNIENKLEKFKIINSKKDNKTNSKLKWIDFITIGNAIMGFLAIIFSVQALYDDNIKFFEYAGLLIIIGIILDIIDGRTARMFKKETALGKELDSLSDTITFVLTPMVFITLFNFYINRTMNPLLLIASILYITTGLIRLGKFNITKFDGQFIGLPTPAAAFLILLLLFYTPNLSIMWPSIIVIIALAMISPIRIKKL